MWSLPRVLCYIILHCVTHMLSVSQISRKFGSDCSDKAQASVDVCVTAVLVCLLVLLFARNPFHLCHCCCTFSSFHHLSSSSRAEHLQHSTCFNRFIRTEIHINITKRLISEHIPALFFFHLTCILAFFNHTDPNSILTVDMWKWWPAKNLVISPSRVIGVLSFKCKTEKESVLEFLFGENQEVWYHITWAVMQGQQLWGSGLKTEVENEGGR